MSEPRVRRPPGPKPRFSKEQLIDEALRLIDDEGFGALSLRAVSRRLGVTPMAMYTYVQSSEALAALVIERMIETETQDLEWPDTWADTIRTFTKGLAELVVEHPAMVEAYAQGAVHTIRALKVADEVLRRLQAGGLSEQEAGSVYAAAHALVLGWAVLRRGAGTSSIAELDLQAFPAAASYRRSFGGLADVELATLVELLLAGVAGTHGEQVGERPPHSPPLQVTRSTGTANVRRP